MVFPVGMYRCDSWTIKKTQHWRTDVFELFCWRRPLRVPLDCKEIKPVHPKGNQPWLLIGWIDTEAEAPILWPLDVKRQLTGKRPWFWERLKAGRDGDNRGWEGWMASPTRWTWVWASSGVGDGQESLACCSPWGHKELDMTERLNWLFQGPSLQMQLCRGLGFQHTDFERTQFSP